MLNVATSRSHHRSTLPLLKEDSKSERRLSNLLLLTGLPRQNQAAKISHICLSLPWQWEGKTSLNVATNIQIFIFFLFLHIGLSESLMIHHSERSTRQCACVWSDNFQLPHTSELEVIWDQTTPNFLVPCVQPRTSSYNFQLSHGRHGHGGHVGHSGRGGHGGYCGHGGQRWNLSIPSLPAVV